MLESSYGRVWKTNGVIVDSVDSRCIQHMRLLFQAVEIKMLVNLVSKSSIKLQFSVVETLPQKYPFDWQYQVSEIVGFETRFVFAYEFRFRCSWNFDRLPTCAFAEILCTSVS